MDRYTYEEVEKMIKDWLGKDVKDRVKELEEPLRKVVSESDTLKLNGYDRIEECPNFVHALALKLYRWDKEDVDKLLKVEDKWEYDETPSARKNIEEYNMIVYKNGEQVGMINVEKVYYTRSGKVECSTTIEGEHVEEGHLVIRGDYDKSPMEILNDFGYKEYEFKCK